MRSCAKSMNLQKLDFQRVCCHPASNQALSLYLCQRHTKNAVLSKPPKKTVVRILSVHIFILNT